MSSRVAVVTGISGQDGAYLARELLESGYEVYGTHRQVNPEENWRLQRLGLLNHPKLQLLNWDITDYDDTKQLLAQIRPDELFNLASHSFVVDSAASPEETMLVSGYACLNLIRSLSETSPKTRFFQAGSSEMFGKSTVSPQVESSSMNPRNLYGNSKLFAHHSLVLYRETEGLFCSEAVLYNHESPLRDSQFVTRKISQGVAKIKHGLSEGFELGNLSSERDWGYAPEYVQAMRLIIQHQDPDTFIISSGRATSVREFVKMAFGAAGINILFEGQGLDEKGIDSETGKKLIGISNLHYRESEDTQLVGNPQKAEESLGWRAKTSIEEIARIMVESDIELIAREKGLNY